MLLFLWNQFYACSSVQNHFFIPKGYGKLLYISIFICKCKLIAVKCIGKTFIRIRNELGVFPIDDNTTFPCSILKKIKVINRIYTLRFFIIHRNTKN